jgi:hypothetical protein
VPRDTSGATVVQKSKARNFKEGKVHAVCMELWRQARGSGRKSSSKSSVAHRITSRDSGTALQRHCYSFGCIFVPFSAKKKKLQNKPGKALNINASVHCMQ